MNAVRLWRSALVLLVVAVLGGAVLGSALPWLRQPEVSVPRSAPPTALNVPTGRPELPDHDIVGEELTRLPRYPGSVRTAYDVLTEGAFRLTVTEYFTDASVDAVRAFYQNVIAEQGWERADIAYSQGAWAYVLVDGRTEALIEIEQSGGLTEIDLQLSEPIDDPAPPPVPTSAPPPPPPPAPPQDDDDDDDDDDASDDGATDD